MSDRLTCDDVAGRDLIARYTGGSIGPADEQALETHVLECRDCWKEMQLAAEIRVAFATDPGRRRLADVSGAPPQRTVSRRLIAERSVAALAIAAALVLAIGIGWQWIPRHADEPVLRGPNDTLSPQLSWQVDGALRVSWSAQDDAAVYRVTLMSAGVSHVSEEVTSTTVVFPKETIPRFPDLSVEIQAETGAGEVVARSRLVRAARPR